MKRTLYQVLGVEHDASAEAIAAAYEARVAELRAAPSLDQSAAALLRDAREILSDTYLRGNYDASLVRPAAEPASAAAPDASAADEKHGGGRRNVAIAAAVVALACMVWLIAHRSHRAPKPAPAAVATPAPAPAAEAAPAADEPVVLSAKDIFNQVSGGIVRVSILDFNGAQLIDQQSGVVIEPGVVLTTCHAAVPGTSLGVQVRGQTLPATLQIADASLDLCRLAVPGLDIAPGARTSVHSLHPGQHVLAVGAPGAGEASIREGVITALVQTPAGPIIHTTAPVAAAWSGGGLYDFSGRLVGIITSHHAYGPNLNVAIPVDWVAQMRNRAADAGASEPRTVNPASIVGRWVCFGSIPGRNGDYTFRDDGRVLVIGSEGQPSDSRYALNQRTLEFSSGAQRAAFTLDSLAATRMVWVKDAHSRVVCDRR